MKTIFRIVKRDVSHRLKDNPYVLLYKIEQKFRIFGIPAYWGTPTFAPPHLFHDIDDAVERINKKCKNASKYLKLK